MPPLGIAPRLSAPQAEVLLLYYSGRTTPGGFEPPRAKHIHLAGEPLNHSGKVSKAVMERKYLNPAVQKRLGSDKDFWIIKRLKGVM